jgi:hypothetical protein
MKTCRPVKTVAASDPQQKTNENLPAREKLATPTSSSGTRGIQFNVFCFVYYNSTAIRAHSSLFSQMPKRKALFASAQQKRLRKRRIDDALKERRRHESRYIQSRDSALANMNLVSKTFHAMVGPKFQGVMDLQSLLTFVLCDTFPTVIATLIASYGLVETVACLVTRCRVNAPPDAIVNEVDPELSEDWQRMKRCDKAEKRNNELRLQNWPTIQCISHPSLYPELPSVSIHARPVVQWVWPGYGWNYPVEAKIYWECPSCQLIYYPCFCGGFYCYESIYAAKQSANYESASCKAICTQSTCIRGH